MKLAELYYQPLSSDESEINVLTVNEMSGSDRELELLYQEAEEYDFLKGKTPKILPDYLEEEE